MNRALTVVIAAAAIILSGLVAGPAAALPPGCTPTFPDAPSQSVVEAGDPAIFTIPGLCLSGPATYFVTSNPDSVGVTVVADGSATAGVTLTPTTPEPGVSVVSIEFANGPDTRTYTFAAYFGVSPEITWSTGPNPNPVAIEKSGTGSFTLPGLHWPDESECEIKVETDKEVDFFTDPPNRSGLPVTFGVKDPDFTGVLSVTYTLTCRPAGGVAESRAWDLAVYVGVPLPVAPVEPQLAATGSGGAPWVPAAVTAALLLVAGGLLRRHVSTSR